MASKSSAEQLLLFDGNTACSKNKPSAPSHSVAPCINCEEQYLSDLQVAARYEISKATVWRWHDKNPEFPRRIKLSPGTSRWKLSELIQFEAKVLAESKSLAVQPVKGVSE